LPIESAWNQLLQFTGHDLKAVILERRSSSIINISLEHQMGYLYTDVAQPTVN
jgi:hypothetical protein